MTKNFFFLCQDFFPSLIIVSLLERENSSLQIVTPHAGEIIMHPSSLKIASMVQVRYTAPSCLFVFTFSGNQGQGLRRVPVPPGLLQNIFSPVPADGQAGGLRLRQSGDQFVEDPVAAAGSSDGSEQHGHVHLG
jgi:hypothetical protein